MNQLANVLLPAAFGAAMQELGYWWQLRFKLSVQKYRAQIRSPEYWIIVFIMIGGSAVGTMYWFGTQITAPKDCMVLGASFPLIFKHAVDIMSHKRPTLGNGQDGKRLDILRSYFQMR
jgi:hypothetical protein